MRRIGLIYGVAASTLIGAFFLTPDEKPLPPEPKPVIKPPPKPVANAPISQLVYSDAAMKVTASLDRAYIKDASGEPLYMDLEVAATDHATRSSLAAVLVIDRSGSMAGDKIDAARLAAERFVSRMQTGDQLAIISYGTDVAVDLDLVTIDAQTRRRARATIARIEEGGGTNIDGGLRAAHRVLTRAKSRLGNATTRIVLISDGRPTEGARGITTLARHSSRATAMGASISTIGVGLDYNEALMERLAADGAGRYHYLKRPSALARILDDELKHASQAVARNVRVHLPAELIGKATPLGQKVENGVLLLGDLAAGEVRHVLFKITPEAANEWRFAAPQFVYTRTTDNKETLLRHRADRFRVVKTNDLAKLESSRRDEVTIRVLEVKTSLALTESMADYSRGNVTKARGELRNKAADLKNAAKRTGSARLADEAAKLDAVLNKMKAAPSSSRGIDLVKSERARAYQLRR